MKPLYKVLVVLFVAAIAGCATPGRDKRESPNDASLWHGTQPYCCNSSAS
jgi:hypothetical protein